MFDHKNGFKASDELLAKKLSNYGLIIIFADFVRYNLISDTGHQAATDINDFVFFVLHNDFVALRLLAKFKIVLYLPPTTSNFENPPSGNSKILMLCHVFEIAKRSIYNCHLHFIRQVTAGNPTQRPTVNAQLSNKAEFFYNIITNSVHILL